ncbi:cupin-like domain-containing protein [Maricaulis maris]|uniref:JmjC domain-containing protein n=1 Tax=Maricaulis maris TaxID=74318 RepID=A0A495D6F4_9PROT|nr:cupin-like domain-containing protein [Maricaulis maris]RKQ96550.1 hypothetical protein C7435_1881 [Maricaulis maris]
MASSAALAAVRRVREIAGRKATADDVDACLSDGEPVIFKGMVADWPAVAEGRESVGRAMAYLLGFAGTRDVVVYRGEAGIDGRFFYNDTLTAMNFSASRAPLASVFDTLGTSADAATTDAVYVGSTDVDAYLPGLRAENDLDTAALFAGARPIVSLWMGNQTMAAAHFDISNNLACCLVGRRRFTLFPPDQVANLYPGPLEPTPGGQVVSMVDFRTPDFVRYPAARQALDAARVAELDPGDVLIYPALWWHQVEALDSFNVMMNYWWNPVPDFIDTPMHALQLAMMSLRDRPRAEKDAWRSLFDYYIFGDAEAPAAHLPAHARGALAPMDDRLARRLRAQLLQRLNR